MDELGGLWSWRLVATRSEAESCALFAAFVVLAFLLRACLRGKQPKPLEPASQGEGEVFARLYPETHFKGRPVLVRTAHTVLLRQVSTSQHGDTQLTYQRQGSLQVLEGRAFVQHGDDLTVWKPKNGEVETWVPDLDSLSRLTETHLRKQNEAGPEHSETEHSDSLNMFLVLLPPPPLPGLVSHEG